MSGDTLSDRALNRATLARQHLLSRRSATPLETVHHLVGMQAQVPLNPYLGLWSRLDPFDPDELGRLVVERVAVRIVVMRGTLHLVTAADALVLRALAQPVLDRELERHSEHASHLRGVDLTGVLAFARTVLAEPRTPSQLRAALAAEFPALDAAALAYACRNHLGLVQVPPRGVWGRAGAVRTTTVEAYLGRPLDPRPPIDDVVLRYLAAFGPASVADVAAWSGLTALREVVDRLAPRVRTVRDERGRELYDLPDAPRPAPDTPALPRFLPEYDNVLLSHADRTRFGDRERRARVSAGSRPVHGSVLVDGQVGATWALQRTADGDGVTMVVHHLDDLDRAAVDVMAAEAEAVTRFLVPGDETYDVEVVALP